MRRIKAMKGNRWYWGQIYLWHTGIIFDMMGKGNDEGIIAVWSSVRYTPSCVQVRVKVLRTICTEISKVLDTFESQGTYSLLVWNLARHNLIYFQIFISAIQTSLVNKPQSVKTKHHQRLVSEIEYQEANDSRYRRCVRIDLLRYVWLEAIWTSGLGGSHQHEFSPGTSIPFFHWRKWSVP